MRSHFSSVAFVRTFWGVLFGGVLAFNYLPSRQGEVLLKLVFAPSIAVESLSDRLGLPFPRFGFSALVFVPLLSALVYGLMAGFAVPMFQRKRNEQDAVLLACYVHVSQPRLSGEDAGQVRGDCERLLDKLGDGGFATALQRQRPEVRSAARAFLELTSIRGAHPKSYRILQAAPWIDWTTNRAFREGQPDAA